MIAIDLVFSMKYCERNIFKLTEYSDKKPSEIKSNDLFMLSKSVRIECKFTTSSKNTVFFVLLAFKLKINPKF